jgi:malate dehydrogenase
MVKVTVVGAAGGIGQPISLLLKQNLPPGSVLAVYDVINTFGVGVDLSHVSTHVKLEIHPGDLKDKEKSNLELTKALTGTDLVVIPAGVPRKPGMTRDDLFKVNAGIVRDIIGTVAKVSPKALIAVITNPVNSIVPVAAEVLKQHGVFDPKRLFGITSLDVVRAQTFIGELKGVDPLSVHVDVVGGHSPETMIPVLSQVKGHTFTDEEITKLTDHVKNAGTEVVNAKDGTGSATLSMAYAGARFALSLVRALKGEKGIVECTFVYSEGIIPEVHYIATPVELGPEGVHKVHPLPHLSEYEKKQLKEAADILAKNIQTGVEFAKGSN